MSDVKLTDDEWTKIRDFLQQDPNAYVGNEAECRRFLEAVKWIMPAAAAPTSIVWSETTTGLPGIWKSV